MKRFVQVLAVLALGMMVSCGGDKPAEGPKPTGQTPAAVSKDSFKGSTLVVYNWVAYIAEDAVKKFEADYGVKVDYQLFPSNEEMFTKVKGAPADYDLVFPSQDYVSIMIKNNLLEPIGPGAVANFKNIDPMVLKMNEGPGAYDPGFQYSVPYNFGAAGILVNKKKLKNYPKSWAIFEMPELKKKGIMLDDMREVLGAALTYKGFSAASTNPAEIAQAKDVVLKWNQNIAKFNADSAAVEFANGEWLVMQFYPENVFSNFKGTEWDDTVDFFHAQEGGPAYVDSMVIPKGAKNKALAIEFINYMLKPEISAINGDSLGLPFIVREADKLRTSKPFYTIEQISKLSLKSDVGEALKYYEEAWTQIKK